MAEESREPGSVAGTQAKQNGPAPATGEPAVAEPAPLVPGAREPELAGDVPAVAGDEHIVTSDGHTAAGEPAVADDEHAELLRLRAEVSALREQTREQTRGQGQGPEARRKARPAGGRWRAPIAVLLITLGCVLAQEAVLAVWAATQVSNTDRFVANMEPLIHEPAIQDALSAEVTSQITSRLNVGALVSSTATQVAHDHLPALSGLLTNFEEPIANGVNGLIGTAVSQFVASPAMATLWVAALRTGHAGVVQVLSGQGNGTFALVDGKVVLNLGPVITQVKQNLSTRGLTIVNSIPAVNPTFPLFEAPDLAKAQQGYRLLLTLKWLLPLLTVALLVAGIWVARGRRHALIGAALGLSLSMLLLGLELEIGRAIYLNSVPQNVLPADAAAAAYDILVRFIKDGLRLLLVIGLVVAAGAFFTGPSTAAVRTRHGVTSGIGWLRTRGERAGLRTGPVGNWTAAHKTLLRIAAIGVAALIFAFWGEPTVALVIWLVVLLLVLLGVIELLGGGTRTTGMPEPAVPEK